MVAGSASCLAGGKLGIFRVAPRSIIKPKGVDNACGASIPVFQWETASAVLSPWPVVMRVRPDHQTQAGFKKLRRPNSVGSFHHLLLQGTVTTGDHC